MKAPVRVVVVDDSPFVCQLVARFLRSDAEIEVVGEAHGGAEGLALVKELKPDAVTLDLDMPVMNGLETLERIMCDCPTPVIVISGVSRRAAAWTLEALEAGAVDFVLKFSPEAVVDPDELQRDIVAKVRTGARVRVVRSLRNRDGRAASAPRRATAPSVARVEPPPVSRLLVPGGVVVIGASTGGPLALRGLLGGLPATFSAAILVVQHMPAMFTSVLAAQLDRHVALPVREARDGDELLPGHVLIAPGNFHLLVDGESRARLNDGPEIGGHRPAVDVTMQSVAQLYGSRTTGVVLTGMGQDGCVGLATGRSKGGRTFAQDAASSVVYGMPQRAFEAGVVDFVGTPAEIAAMLLAERSRGAGAPIVYEETGNADVLSL
jgi:two-component system chemotaxis response regulator CheB